MPELPLVSVVATTYNQVAYIGETLRSVFAQTYPCYEVILVDDGSSDGTADAVRPFLDRITYVRQANQGVAGARNAGIARARGGLIALLDGDDLWDREKLQVQVDAFLRFPRAGLIAVNVDYFDGDAIVFPSSLRTILETISPQHADECVSRPMYEQLLETNWIVTTSSVMIPAPVLREVGPSDPRFAIGSDYDLYLRIAEKYDVTLIGRVLAKWRFLPTSASGAAEDRKWRWADEIVHVLAKHARSGRIDKRAVLRQARNRSASRLAENVYLAEDQTGAAVAARRLTRLALAAPTSWTPIWCLSKTLIPTPLRRAVGPVLRAMRRGRVSHSNV